LIVSIEWSLDLEEDSKTQPFLKMSDGHHHHHGDDCCGHGGGAGVGDEKGVLYSLYTKIYMDQVQCLNEVIEGSGKKVFKPWEDRLNGEGVESDADEELLFNIPFTGNIKLKGLIVIGGEGGSHPASVKLFKNRPFMTFDDTSVEADQELQLAHDTDGTVEYNVKIVKFSSVNHLSLHFPKNYGEDSTKIYYIGFKGEFTAAQRDAILLTSYETTPNPADHKAEIPGGVFREIQ
jgi:hypothetical protein